MKTPERKIDYLRISLTDLCNQRCLYCRPSSGHSEHGRLLTTDQVLRVVKAAAGLGFRKFRLTGGEPLARPDLPDIVKGMAAISGVDCLGLSTNGTLLSDKAALLRKAGLKTVNISLDALNPSVYRNITGGDVRMALAGIRAALDAGYDCVKLNCVLLKGINEQELWPLVLFASENRMPLRLIELMPVSMDSQETKDRFLPVTNAMEWFRQKDEMIPLPDRHLGYGPARYYRLRKTNAVVGFIGSVTTPHFCASCNRVRLTADGRLRPCLGQHGEVDATGVWSNQDKQDQLLHQLLIMAMEQKPDSHDFDRGYTAMRPMISIGG